MHGNVKDLVGTTTPNGWIIVEEGYDCPARVKRNKCWKVKCEKCGAVEHFFSDEVFRRKRHKCQ